MLQYNPSVSGSLTITGSLNVSNGITGTIGGIDVSVLSASVAQTFTTIQSTTGSQSGSLGAINQFTSSASSRLSNLETTSGSNIGRLNNIEATTAFVRPVLILSSNTSVAIDITLRIGMPQLEIGSVANSVIATSGTAYYGPRLDYNPSTLAPLGLLIEEQRTNLLTYSSDITNAAWNKGNTSIAAAAKIGRAHV